MMLRRDYDFVKTVPPPMEQHSYYYDRNRNQVLQVMSNTTREAPRTYPISRSNRNDHRRELAEENIGHQQRRRIAVACSRCRKRKIRCSGPVGAGQSCRGCINSGVELCAFNRVGSHEMGLFPGTPTPHANHIPDCSSVPTPPITTNMTASGPIVRSLIHYQPGGQMSMTRSIPVQDWNSTDYDPEPSLDMYTLPPPSTLIASDAYQVPYSMSEVERSWSTTILERPVTTTAFYGSETVVNCPPSTVTTVPQVQITSEQNQMPITQTPVSSTDRILPVPNARLGSQYATPANLNEMTARTALLSIHPGTSIYSRPNISWTNDNNSFDSRSSPTSHSDSTEDLSILSSKSLHNSVSSNDMICSNQSSSTTSLCSSEDRSSPQHSLHSSIPTLGEISAIHPNLSHRSIDSSTAYGYDQCGGNRHIESFNNSNHNTASIKNEKFAE